jgi:hypothetical protein
MMATVVIMMLIKMTMMVRVLIDEADDWWCWCWCDDDDADDEDDDDTCDAGDDDVVDEEDDDVHCYRTLEVLSTLGRVIV